MIPTARRRQESGFALLMVFLMASVVAVMLYMQLPRAAFESQRAKEEMLQERGEQYIRAIQLYVAKWRSYPPSLDALEKTNNVRFLRKRYKDPMTGKDEWRAIHVNAAGQLVDSLVQKQGGEAKPNQYQNNFITEMPSIGATGNTGDAAQNAAMRRRPSDQAPAPGMGGPSGNVPTDPQSLGFGAQLAPNAQAANGQIPGQGQPGQPGQNMPGQGVPGQDSQNAQPGQLNPNGTVNPLGQMAQQQPVQPGQQQQPFQPGQQQPFQPGQQPFQPGQPNPYGQVTQPGQPPVPPQPGQQPYPVPTPPGGAPGYPNSAAVQQGRPGGANQGIEMINRILTTPRNDMNMAIPGAQGLQIGGGIAGFASKMEAPSIKVYNERQKYNEWEFVYDMKKDKRLLGAAAAATGQQQRNPLGNQQNQNIPNPMTNSPNPSNSTFNGVSGGFNQGTQPTSPGFGQTGGRR